GQLLGEIDEVAGGLRSDIALAMKEPPKPKYNLGLDLSFHLPSVCCEPFQEAFGAALLGVIVAGPPMAAFALVLSWAWWFALSWIVAGGFAARTWFALASRPSTDQSEMLLLFVRPR